MKFLKNTDYMKNLFILSEIEKGEPVTQAILANVAGVSVAMVNTYIRNLCNDGYITMQGNNKNRIYQITKKGLEQKKYLLVSLMAELIEITNAVSDQIKQALVTLTNKGILRVFLYGAGETGKVCRKVIADIPKIEVLGFIDDDITLQNTLIFGDRIFDLDEALKMQFDKIIITTFIGGLNIKDKLINRLGDSRKIELLSEMGTGSWQRGL